MATYWLAVVEGETVSSEGAEYFEAPLRRFVPVQAPSRVDAYLRAFRELSAGGADVTVVDTSDRSPLGFTPEEIERIHAAGGTIRAGFPRRGLQIEQLVRTQGPPGSDRAEVRLPEMPGLMLSSTEDETHGRWLIFYHWEKGPSHDVCFMTGEPEVDALVEQARETAIREGGRSPGGEPQTQSSSE